MLNKLSLISVVLCRLLRDEVFVFGSSLILTIVQGDSVFDFCFRDYDD